jgi:hypothetical protein
MSFSYARREKPSFVVVACKPYLACMENRDEFYVFESEARRMRAEELARLMRKAVAWFGSLGRLRLPRAKEMKHA